MKIMLDAGHAGKANRSPCDKRYYESEVMWRLCEAVGKLLCEASHTVSFTREKQEKDLEVTKRGKKAKNHALFLSFHSNAVGGGGENSKVDHPTVYRALSASERGIGFADALADLIADTMETKEAGRVAVREGAGGKDYFGVIRGAVAAGCHDAFLIEHSFHTNPEATAFLLDENKLLALARAEAALIDTFWKEERVYFAVPTGYTGHSISKALKLIGEENSLAYRKEIGKINGIDGVGTAKSNTRMLKMLMAGELLKP